MRGSVVRDGEPFDVGSEFRAANHFSSVFHDARVRARATTLSDRKSSAWRAESDISLSRARPIYLRIRSSTTRSVEPSIANDYMWKCGSAIAVAALLGRSSLDLAACEDAGGFLFMHPRPVVVPCRLPITCAGDMNRAKRSRRERMDEKVTGLTAGEPTFAFMSPAGLCLASN